MSVRRVVLSVGGLVFGLSGCGGGGRTARTVADSVDAAVSPGNSSDTGRPVPRRPVDTSAVRPESTPTKRAPPVYVKGDSLPLVTVAQIVSANTPVGERVRVRGTCIGYSRVVATGPQPQTRSDWQLTSEGVAIWVVGPYPAGCSGTVPAAVSSTLIVEVAEDTLPVLGGRPPRLRRYLVYHQPR